MKIRCTSVVEFITNIYLYVESRLIKDDVREMPCLTTSGGFRKGDHSTGPLAFAQYLELILLLQNKNLILFFKKRKIMVSIRISSPLAPFDCLLIRIKIFLKILVYFKLHVTGAGKHFNIEGAILSRKKTEEN